MFNLTFMVRIQTNSPCATFLLGFDGVLRLFLDSYNISANDDNVAVNKFSIVN